MKSDSEIPATPSLVDMDRLEEMSDGGPEGSQELAGMYIESMGNNFVKLREAVKNDRPDEIERIAHSAVGASSLVGMVGVVPLLRKLEDLGERKLMGDVPATLNELFDVYSRMCGVLRSSGIIPEGVDMEK